MTVESKLPLWSSQVAAYNFAKDLPGFMGALDMGCGKSAIAVALIHNLRWPLVLILCPKSVGDVWPNEFRKHDAGERWVEVLCHGPTKVRATRLKKIIPIADIKNINLVVVVNYQAAILEPLRAAILQVPWSAVILDESHRIKAPGGKASWLCKALGAKVPRRICLTGTPLPHSPLDAYAQYRFLDRDIFGTSYTAFRARYAIMGGFKNKQVVSYQRMDEFEAKLKKIMYRVTAEEVQDLPETVDIERTYTLPDNAQKIYDDLKDEFCALLEAGVVTASNALVKLLRLQQITSGYVQSDADPETGGKGEMIVLHNQKAALLADWLEDIPDTEPVIIFCRFVHDLAMIQDIFKARVETCGELSGKCNQLADWQAGSYRALAVQIQAGGVGVDFTRARYCVYYSQTFSLGDYLQSRKRIHRHGQFHNVVYLHLLANQTIDRQIYKALQARQDVVTAILEGGLE